MSSKPKAPPPPTEPTLMDDGFTVHPERLIHKSDPEAQGKTKIAGIDLVGEMSENYDIVQKDFRSSRVWLA